MIVILSTSNSISITFRIRYIIFRPDTIQKIYSLQCSHNSLTWIDFIEEVFVFVHPDLHDSLRVVVDDASHAPGPRVGRGLPEHMTHAGTGHYVNLTPTHPNLQKKIRSMRLLSSPHIQTYKDKWGHCTLYPPPPLLPTATKINIKGHYLHFNPTHTHLQSKIRSILAISTIWNRHFVLSTSTIPPSKIVFNNSL